MPYNSELYMHELDRKATAALNTFPRFINLLEAYHANYDEKAAKIHFLSSAIRLSENQMPEIYNLLPPICDKLGIAVPELYYVKSKKMNAATGGSTQPYICVTSQLVEELPYDLMPSVLAHECGHIACKHSLYHSIAMQLVEGIEKSPLALIPAIRVFLTPALVRALLFWDRCSELSADRAAVLCDGGAEKMVDVLLKIHGYDENIDRNEFLKQALDLKAFVNDSKSNKFLEQMLVEKESHPRMATRAYECYEWAKSAQCQEILDGTYTVKAKQAEEDICSEEVVTAELTVTAENSQGKIDLDTVNQALQKVNMELERYTSSADKTDYAVAIGSGILSGIIDSVFVGEFKITDDDIEISRKQIECFIKKYANARGFGDLPLEKAIGELEKAFKVAQDNVWKGVDSGVAAINHHLADLAHHPTPLGLMASLVVQFLRIGTFVNREGDWHFILVETHSKDLLQVLTPALLTGVLNWLVAIAEKRYAEEEGHEIPEILHKLAHLVASTPILIEVAKCADNWFGHLVSDMGGSKNTAGDGMGIPGIFLSFLYEIASLPGLKDSGLPYFVNDLYQNQKIDLRHELTLYKAIGKQTVPIVLNETMVRVGYFVTHFVSELDCHDSIKNINWSNVIPIRSRTVDRMLTISSMTFVAADTADAAIHAAIESGGNWVLFSGRFVTRVNYVGAGRTALAIVKEVSNEKKETQLIHEKMLLSEAKASLFLEQLQEFKAKLEEKVSNYLAEDISEFMSGFDYMQQGLAAGDSDLVIRGNVIIQKVLGREPQFTNQEEFDALMESELPLTL